MAKLTDFPTTTKTIIVHEDFDYDVRKLLLFRDELIIANCREMNIPVIENEDTIFIGFTSDELKIRNEIIRKFKEWCF